MRFYYFELDELYNIMHYVVFSSQNKELQQNVKSYDKVIDLAKPQTY